MEVQPINNGIIVQEWRSEFSENTRNVAASVANDTLRFIPVFSQQGQILRVVVQTEGNEGSIITQLAREQMFCRVKASWNAHVRVWDVNRSI